MAFAFIYKNTIEQKKTITTDDINANKKKKKFSLIPANNTGAHKSVLYTINRVNFPQAQQSQKMQDSRTNSKQ